MKIYVSSVEFDIWDLRLPWFWPSTVSKIGCVCVMWRFLCALHDVKHLVIDAIMSQLFSQFACVLRFFRCMHVCLDFRRGAIYIIIISLAAN